MMKFKVINYNDFINEITRSFTGTRIFSIEPGLVVSGNRVWKVIRATLWSDVAVLRLFMTGCFRTKLARCVHYSLNCVRYHALISFVPIRHSERWSRRRLQTSDLYITCPQLPLYWRMWRTGTVGLYAGGFEVSVVFGSLCFVEENRSGGTHHWSKYAVGLGL